MISVLLSDRGVRSMLLLLTVMAGAAALYVAKPILAPIVFGVVVGVVVSPLADRLSRHGIPRVFVALSALATASFGLIAFVLALEPVISSIEAKLPELRAEFDTWVAFARDALGGIEKLNDEIERTVGSDSSADLADSIPTVMDAVLLAPNFGAQVLIFIGTLFFFILARNDVYNAAGSARDRFYNADRAVARYFGAVTLVNTGLGVITALVLMLLGVNNAILWGFAAGLLNFMMYFGPITIMIGLLIAGILQFSGAMSLLPMLAFVGLNVTEAQFVTPAVVGHHIRMSPLVVFLAIVVGLWLWGPIGAIVALPTLLWLYVVLTPAGAQIRTTTDQIARLS